jgi:hypothetical protein
MRYVRVTVKRDNNTTSNSFVAPWEVPILRHLFEDGNVEELDEHAVSQRDYPDAAAEFQRLAKVYGGDTTSGIAHVVSVFGEGMRGVKSLREMIEESVEADQKAKRPSPASARSTRTKNPKTYADPLLN